MNSAMHSNIPESCEAAILLYLLLVLGSIMCLNAVL
jgi:hypothetical protein